MATTRPYKGYEGTADMDMERQVCRGRILFIDDLVTYEAESPAALQQEFEAAVDDYIETCELVGKEAQKPLKGQFNVRITPTLHRAASVRACRDGVSLNEVIGRALEAYVNPGQEVRHSHNVRVTFDESPESTRTVTTSVAVTPTWQSLGVHHAH